MPNSKQRKNCWSKALFYCQMLFLKYLMTSVVIVIQKRHLILYVVHLDRAYIKFLVCQKIAPRKTSRKLTGRLLVYIIFITTKLKGT